MSDIRKLKRFQSDATLKEEGAWHGVVFSDETETLTLQLKMRSTDSDKVVAWDLARYRKQRAMYEHNNTPPLPVIRQNQVDRLAEAIIVDWDLADGETPIPCTPDNVRQIMAEFPDLRAKATQLASETELYRRAQTEALAKNSATPSQQN